MVLMIPLLLFGFAFALRVIVGVAFPDPAYPDSFYYVNLARQLSEGNGFQVDYIWSFAEVGGRIPSDPQLPVPSNGLWMPLGAIVQVPFIWLLGPTAVASSLPFWIIGAAASPLAYSIGIDAGAGRTLSLAAAGITAAPGGVAVFLSQPDNFGPFMTLGALALWLCARASRGDRRSFVAGGFVVGLATLTRNDGVLLGAPFALVALRQAWGGRSSLRAEILPAIACAAAFGVVAAPWWFRQLHVFGSISPSSVILWMTEHDQLFSIGGDPPTLGSFLSQGAGSLLKSRVSGLISAATIFVVWPLAIVLTPFAITGAWLRRYDQWFGPFFVYTGLFFASSAALFAVYVPHGFFIHSAVALLPHTFVLVVIGIASVARWAAQRRATWNAEQATKFFTAGAFAISLLAAAVQTSSTLGRWSEDREVRQAVAASLTSVPVDDVLMSPDPGAYRYFAGMRGIVTPTDPLPVIAEAARSYHVRWLVLERNHMVSALAPILRGDIQPEWLSLPLTTIPQSSAAGDAPAAALYAVCFSAADTRCGP